MENGIARFRPDQKPQGKDWKCDVYLYTSINIISEKIQAALAI